MNTMYLMIIKSEILSFKKNKRLLFFYYFMGYIIPLIISSIFLIDDSYGMQDLNYCLINIKENEEKKINDINYIFYSIHVLPILYCLFFFLKLLNFIKKCIKLKNILKFFFYQLNYLYYHYLYFLAVYYFQ